MKCPMCDNSRVITQAIEEVEVERCPECHGIWLDANELETLIGADPKELLREDRVFQSSPGDAGPRLECPRCKGARLIKLNSRLRPGTIVDSCTVCFGTWLDAGEFTRLAGGDLWGYLRRVFRG